MLQYLPNVTFIHCAFIPLKPKSVNAVQPWNALSPIWVTLFGMVTAVKPKQPLNARLPMVVTLSGSVTVVKPVQPEKA